MSSSNTIKIPHRVKGTPMMITKPKKSNKNKNNFFVQMNY